MSRILLAICLISSICGCGGTGQPEEPTNPDPPPGARFSGSSANSKAGIARARMSDRQIVFEKLQPETVALLGMELNSHDVPSHYS